MESEIFSINTTETDECGKPFIIHVTEEVNGFIVWFSNYHCDGREYQADRVFRKWDRDKAIIYAVEKGRGVCL